MNVTEHVRSALTFRAGVGIYSPCILVVLAVTVLGIQLGVRLGSITQNPASVKSREGDWLNALLPNYMVHVEHIKSTLQVYSTSNSNFNSDSSRSSDTSSNALVRSSISWYSILDDKLSCIVGINTTVRSERNFVLVPVDYRGRYANSEALYWGASAWGEVHFTSFHCHTRRYWRQRKQEMNMKGNKKRGK